MNFVTAKVKLVENGHFNTLILISNTDVVLNFDN